MKPRLIILDIDNTVFDWVQYYTLAMRRLLDFVRDYLEVSEEEILEQAKYVFSKHNSIEYPFLVQEMPVVIERFADDLDKMLKDLVEPARLEFKRVGLPHLKPYDGVRVTLDGIRERLPDVPLVALTDAPRYVAMWKLNKLELLHHFDAVYGLADPRIPTDDRLGRVKVDPKILLKHLQQSNFGYEGRIRILPDDYEKPGTRGLKTVLMDYEIEEGEARKDCLWVGDNLRKDVELGHRVGVTSVWAKFGTDFDKKLKEKLVEFSPADNVQKHIALDPKSAEAPEPHFTLESFDELAGVVEQMAD